MKERVEIEGLDSLKHAIEKVASELHNPFKDMNERSQHREILGIQEKQADIQKEHLNILKEQGNIIEKQTYFSWLLMLATVVLALGTFIQVSITLLQIPRDTYNNLYSSLGFGAIIIFFFGTFFIFIFMGVIIYLIVHAFWGKSSK